MGESVHLDDLQGTQEFHGFRAYGRSKLELILLTRELARRLAGTGVTVNALHPGFVRSGFGRNNGGGVAIAIRFFALIGGRSPRSGAQTSIYLACAPEVGSRSGEYFSRSRMTAASHAAGDAEMGRRLYDACLPFLGLPTLPATLAAGGPR